MAENGTADATGRVSLTPLATEDGRLAALRSYCVLDTAREARFDDLTHLVSTICETPVSLISLVDAKRLFFKSAHGLDLREVPFPEFCCGHAIRQRDVFEVPDLARDPRFASHPLVAAPPHARFYAGAPLLTSDNHALGTLCAVDFVPRKLTATQTETLRILARQVMSHLENNLLAMRDPLTGLYNRRQLEESLQREILRAGRSDAAVGVMAIDIDHFKVLNDTLGHEMGDAALRGFAHVLVDCVREEDVACRAGGEEFVIILPGAYGESLHARAEGVRRAIESARITVGDTVVKLTASIGLASFPESGATGATILRAADAALYKAKAAGRNRIVACPSNSPRPLAVG